MSFESLSFEFVGLNYELDFNLSLKSILASCSEQKNVI